MTDPILMQVIIPKPLQDEREAPHERPRQATQAGAEVGAPAKTVARLTPAVAKKFPILPAHPERICWGCDKYCRADAMMCGNGSVATPHPSELFGEDWMSWGLDAQDSDSPATPETPEAPE